MGVARVRDRLLAQSFENGNDAMPLRGSGPDSAVDIKSSISDVVKFRRFSVMPGERRVLCNGLPIEIGGRAFDLLLVLLKSRGELVTKEEIVSYVWPSTVVDESNLRFQMASLRKALGEDRDVIKTVPRRGYVLVTEEWSDRIADRHLQLRPVHINCGHVSDADCRVIPLVVVIDDDEGTREALYGLLKSVGWQVETFESVQSFVNRPSRSTPSCLVLDVWMPGGSGLDFQSELVSVGQTVPVIFISGRADIAMTVRAMKAGAMEFLTKPVRHEELLTAISVAVGSSLPAHA
jgi:DNA-binding response OmpR family regulator